jgi:CheY-like chemotaxis protein
MPHKLLLADDSVTIQRVIELTFADEDIQVIAVGDGQQAIDRIDSEHPDVVLADIGMPERDGYEVAAHVKGNPQTAHIPVVLLTGAFEPIDEARARAVGCDGVLVKPFEPQMVINRVKDLLAGRRPASLWSTPPGPTGTVITPHGGASGAVGIVTGMIPPATEAPMHPAAEPAGGATDSRSFGSLDEYFDRLDAAFSDAEPPAAPKAEPPPVPPTPTPAPAVHDDSEFGSWDIPERAGQLTSPAAAPPSAVSPAPPPAPSRSPAEIPTIAPEMSPVAQAPELAGAFAALLAAEQQFTSTPAAAPASAATPGRALDEAAIEEIVSRVLAKMTDEVVRTTVLDVAERLVRAEIDRIKHQANL